MRNMMMKTVFALSAVLFVRTSANVNILVDSNGNCPPGFYLYSPLTGDDYCKNWCVFVSLMSSLI